MDAEQWIRRSFSFTEGGKGRISVMRRVLWPSMSRYLTIDWSHTWHFVSWANPGQQPVRYCEFAA